MYYKTTRGGAPTTFEAALFSGYAPDGGLYVPKEIPELTTKLLTEWRTLKLTYSEVVTKIVRMYISPEEISNDALHNCVRRAFDTFSKDGIIEIARVKDAAGNSAKVAELYHGRTGSFKDLALSLVGQFMGHFMLKRNERVIVLVGTSGDTGSAAIDAIRGSKSIDIIVLYPKGMVSQVQEWQMRSALEKNVHLYEVEGTSDDLDIPIKQCFPSPGVISINSINWARIMIQIAHYVYLYLLEGEEIEVIVPTGAAGNLASGLFAQKMGLPLKLHVVTNKNDCIHVMLSNGNLKIFGDIEATPANAMDIRNPYNVERILYLFCSDSKTLLDLVDKPDVQIPADILKSINSVIIGSMSIEDELIYATMKKCWDINKYLICPHTATAMYYFSEKLSGNPRVYILSTASPYKFVESVEKCGIPKSDWNSKNPFDALISCPKLKPKLMAKGGDWYKILQDDIKHIKSK